MFSNEKAIFAVLAVLSVWTNTATAAEHNLYGRWQDGSNSVGVIQFGQQVFVFSKDGWSVGALDPQGAGILANGKGMWTFDARQEPATASLGERDGHLYLIVEPADANGRSEIKMVLEPILPETPPNKV